MARTDLVTVRNRTSTEIETTVDASVWSAEIGIADKKNINLFDFRTKLTGKQFASSSFARCFVYGMLLFEVEHITGLVASMK